MAPAPEERGKGGSHTDRKSWHGAASSLCLPPGTPHLEDFGETRVPHADRKLPPAPRVGGPVTAATHVPLACGSPTPAFVPRGASAQTALAGPSPAAPPRGEGILRIVLIHFLTHLLISLHLQFQQCTKKPSSFSLYITPWMTRRFIWKKR